MKAGQASLSELGVPLTLSPMEALLVPELPQDASGWQFEPKWDGFRCPAFRAGGEVEIKAKSGKSLSRFFPEVLTNLRALPHSQFVLDGELVIPADGELSFDALQMRLHPAQSRIFRLSHETPATLIAFDCLLARSGRPLLAVPFRYRREALDRFFAKADGAIRLALTPFTRDLRIAKQWLAGGHASIDGVVAKPLDLPYRAGERAMLYVRATAATGPSAGLCPLQFDRCSLVTAASPSATAASP